MAYPSKQLLCMLTVCRSKISQERAESQAISHFCTFGTQDIISVIPPPAFASFLPTCPKRTCAILWQADQAGDGS